MSFKGRRSTSSSRRNSSVFLNMPDPIEELKKEKPKIDSDIWKCAEFGYLSQLKQISAENDINAKDNTGRTPLSWATRNGHSAIVKYLISTGAQQQTNPGGLQLAHFAAHNYTEGLIEELIANGCSITGTDDGGNTVLHWAARRGILNPIQSFLDAGADLNALNHQGSTALHLAVNNGHYNCANYLLKKGISADAADIDGNTPAHIAAMVGFENILNLLKTYNANFNISNKNGNTPYDVAITPVLKTLIKSLGGETGKK